MLDSDGQVAFPYVSRGSLDIYGYTPEQIIADATVALDAVHPHDTPLLHAMIEESAETLSEFRWTGRVRHSSGEYCWIRAIAQPERLLDESVLWSGYLSDVTARMHAQEAIRKSSPVESAE